MNRIILSTFLSLVFVALVNAQKLEKIKGNKNVTTEQTTIPPFNKIIVGDDFDIELVESSDTSVDIETDENLHEVIKFEVKDSTLLFSFTHNITSKRRLNITVKYDNNLQYLEALDNGVIRSRAPMDLEKVNLKTFGASKAYLTIKANDFKMLGGGRSKTKLNLTALNTKLELSDNTYLIALINSDNFTTDLYQRADAVIEGTCKEALIRTDNSSQFKGKDFTINNCKAICEIGSDAFLEVLTDITLELSGSSAIYLYGNPKITVSKFADSAKLQKRAK